MNTRAYRLITSRTSPNQNARPGPIRGITIHWWGRPVGQDPEGVVSWLCSTRSRVSAHAVISGETVWRIVDPRRRAWHAGNSAANDDQIGLELDPNASRRAATERTAAAYIADLRGEYGDLPLSPHRRWTDTECPGDWDLDHLDALARGLMTAEPQRLTVDGRFGHATVRALQDWLNSRGAGLATDGKAGHATWRALQGDLGTPVDGIVSHQSFSAAELGNGITQGWQHDGRGAAGSTMVRALQTRLGVGVDGIWFEGTTAALQRHLSTD